ncbi:hypothetical protein [Aquisalimonas sp.]|uniref:hypothetical protein n=1 Tax=unclassified Aquisalimonas TaxID=2644645 RepID=UPI0025C27A56|nr:hypothetical protein [Aquisalimonas sp.]
MDQESASAPCSNGELGPDHLALMRDIQTLATPWRALLVYQMPWPGQAVSIAAESLEGLAATLRQRAGPLRHLSETGLHSVIAIESSRAGFGGCITRRIDTTFNETALLVLLAPDTTAAPPATDDLTRLERRITDLPSPTHPGRQALERAGLDPETGLPDHDGFCQVLQGMLGGRRGQGGGQERTVFLAVLNLAPGAMPAPSARAINETAHRLLRQLGPGSRVGRITPAAISAAIAAGDYESEDDVVRRISRILPSLPDTGARPAIKGLRLRRSDMDQPARRLQQTLDRTG